MTPNTPHTQSPDYGAHVRTVYWEPIFGSGERFAIIVAAQAEDAWHVQDVVGKPIWDCFLGNQSKTAIRLINMIIDSFRNHLQCGKRIETWSAPLSGIHTSETRYIFAQNMTQIIRIAMRDTCAFAVLPQSLDFNDDVAEQDTNNEPDRWPVQVRNIVVDRKPYLSQFFNRKFTLRDNARETKLDFAGNHYVANFAKLLPDIQLGQWVGKAKIKLLDLEQVRNHATRGDLFTDNSGTAQIFEMIMYRPAQDDPGYTEKAMKNMEKAVLQLEDFADSHEMRLIISHNANSAADRLIEREAA